MKTLFDEYAKLRIEKNITIAMAGRKFVQPETRAKIRKIDRLHPEFYIRFDKLTDEEILSYQ